MLRHESELGVWELVTRAPDPRLRGYVGDYQGYVESGSPRLLRQQVPTPSPADPELRLAVERRLVGRRPHVSHDSFVAGSRRGSSYVGATGPASCVQVNLTPLGAHMFFGLPMHELANRRRPLEAALPRTAHALTEPLEDEPGWRSASRCSMRSFSPASPMRRRLADVAWAWRVLEETHGRAPIGWICDGSDAAAAISRRGSASRSGSRRRPWRADHAVRPRGGPRRAQ